MKRKYIPLEIGATIGGTRLLLYILYTLLLHHKNCSCYYVYVYSNVYIYMLLIDLLQMDFLAFSADDTVAPTSISLTAKAPWMVCAVDPPSTVNTEPVPPLVGLHNEIVALCEFVSPTDDITGIRRDLVSELTGIIHSVFPASTVHVFGSEMTKILTPNSDLDLAVMNAGGDGVDSLYKLEEALLSKGICSYLEVIANAKVPIVKLDHIASGISVDILCSNEYGMAAFETGKIMKRFVSDYPALKPLTILLKIFLVIFYHQRVNET